MRYLKYVVKSVTVINLILVSAVAAASYYILVPQFHMNIKYSPPQPKKTEVAEEKPAAQGQAPSPFDYTIIAEQNLFHPERKIPVEKPAAPPLPKPEFILYGTLVTEDASIAYMDDKKSPQTTPGRGKRQTALRKGESLSGFTLKEIGEDKVFMVRGDETVTVTLNESQKAKTREVTGVTQPVAQPLTPQPQPLQQPLQPQQLPIPAGAAQTPAQAAAQRQIPETPPPPSGPASSAKKSFIDLFKGGGK